jgi:hypothetical protein
MSVSHHSDKSSQNYHQEDGEISFATVNAVDQSWRSIRQIPNYEVVVGERLFLKLFEVTPRAAKVFSFGLEDTKALSENKLFKRHAKDIIHLLDEVVDMLGPDMIPLSDTLKELGARHVRYGVLPYYFEVMLGQGLMHALETTLGETKWTPMVQHGWEGVCHFMSSSMIEGATEERERLRGSEVGSNLTTPTGKAHPSIDVLRNGSSSYAAFKESLRGRSSATNVVRTSAMTLV